MGFENKYPYTDFHEMNLDWILELVKRLETEWPEFKTTLETEWNEYKDELTGENGEWPTFKTQIETIVRNFIHDVVGNYNGNLDYKPGMFCYYEGNVYKCTTGSSAAYPRPFSAYGWFIYAGQNTNSIVNDLFNYLTDTLNGYDTEIFYWIQHTAAEWDDTTAYKAGDYCSAYVGGFMTPSSWRYYKCIQDCTGINVFNTNYWKEVVLASDVAETIAAYKQAMQDQYDQFLEDYQRTFGVVQVRGSSTTDVMSQKAVSDELQAHDDLIDNLINDIADPYDSTKAYKIGNLLTYLGKQYYCIADAPAGTLPTNTTYFEEKSVADIIEMIKAGTIVVGHSAVADNLTPYSEDSGTTQENPFISQGTGTDNNSVIVTTGNIARQLEKQGNTLRVCQVFNYQDTQAGQTISGITVTNNNDGTYTVNGTATANAYIDLQSNFQNRLVANHTYLIMANNSKGANGGARLVDSFSNKFATKESMVYTYTSGVMYVSINVLNGVTCDNEKLKPLFFDITGWNSDIITDLTSHPEHFSWYYNGSMSYDAGSLQNANGRYLECGQGRQLWDEVTELGEINMSTGQNTVSSTTLRSKNYCDCIPNQKCYFYMPSTLVSTGIYVYWYDANKNFISVVLANTANTIIKTAPANARFFRIVTTSDYGTTYNHDITISLYYTPEQGGEGYNQHYDYIAPIRIDTGDETLKAFDKKLPSGVIERNTGEYTFTGNEAIVSISNNRYRIQLSNYATNIKSTPANIKANAIMNGLVCSVKNNLIDYQYQFALSNEGSTTVMWMFVYLTDSSTSNDVKTFLTGKTIQYELETPTTEQGTPFSEYADINDYSYMAWFDTDGNLVSIPQGCKLFYPVDYKGFLDDGVMYTDGDFTSLAKNEDITDAALNARGYYKLQDLSSDSSIITPATGLEVNSKKIYKIGDVVFMFVIIANRTGATIPANTQLFTLASGYRPRLASSWQSHFSAVAGNANGDLTITYNTGVATYNASIYANSQLIFNISYIV